MDMKLLDILACPLCKGALVHRREAQELVCRVDRLAWPIREGVPVMLVGEAREVPQEELYDMERK